MEMGLAQANIPITQECLPGSGPGRAWQESRTWPTG